MKHEKRDAMKPAAEKGTPENRARDGDIEKRVPGSPASSSMVKAVGIDFAYGQGESRKQVLFNCHLTISPGEIVVMTGPSGSGKTTLLTLIGALRSVQKGSLATLGRELKGMSPAEQVKLRRDIGFIFQAHNLFESLTAYQTVYLATELRDYSKRDRRVLPEKILAELGLKDRLNYKPKKLSEGQKQRVAIARALVNRPRLILADEPTAALDKENGKRVMDLFKDLTRKEDCSVLIVSHDNRIFGVADRIVNMVDGYIESDTEMTESVALTRFLENCAAFEGVGPEILLKLASIMVLEPHGDGSEIYRAGDPGEKLYLLKSGRAEVTREIAGRAEVVNVLGAGEFFGQRALFQGEEQRATVRVIEDTELLTLSREQFHAVVEESPAFGEHLKKVHFQ
jgi:putative ABC transport system ATP-binding protein